MLRGVFEPAVVVGDDADRGVADLLLAGQEDLGHVGHAQQVAASPLQEQAHHTGAQARPLDAGVGDIAVQRDAQRGGLARHTSRSCDR